MNYNWRARGLTTLVALLALLAFPLSIAHGQIFNKEEIDYDKLFRQGISLDGKTLNLSGKKIGDEGVRILVSHAIIKKVTKLDLRYNELTEKGARYLAESGNLSQLKSLELRHNFLGDAGAIPMAESENLEHIKDLKLGWNEIRDAGALAFAKTKKMKKLEKLDLRGNFLSDETKTELKKSLANLKSLLLY